MAKDARRDTLIPKEMETITENPKTISEEIAALLKTGSLSIQEEKNLFVDYLLALQNPVDQGSRAFAIRVVASSAVALGLKVSTLREVLSHLEADPRLE